MEIESLSLDAVLHDYHFDYSHKSGVELDNFVGLFGFSRIKAKRSTGTVVFSRGTTASQNYGIPTGTQVFAPASGELPAIYFTVTTSGVISIGQTQAEVTVEANLAGTIGNVAAGAITIIGTPLQGITNVTNNLPLTGGRDLESDEGLRARWRVTVFRNLAGTEDMYLGICYRDQDVDRALVVGPVQRFREQLEIAAASATSQNADSKYSFPPGSELIGYQVGLSTQTLGRRGVGNDYCVDEATEILSDAGWIGWDHLQPGMEVLTLNPTTRLAEWNEVQAMNAFHRDGPMLLIKSPTHSSMTTPNHRWILSKSGSRGWHHRGGTGPHIWTTSRELLDYGEEWGVPLSAPPADAPEQAKYLDDFVELVAWYWTEGWRATTPDKGRASVRTRSALWQPISKNPGNVDRIRGVLERQFGPAGGGVWRECIIRRSIVQFDLNRDVTTLLDEVAPGKVPSMRFLRALTRAQLSLFIEVSLLADRDGKTALAQKSHERASAFEAACALAGISTNTSRTKAGMWRVQMVRRARVGLGKLRDRDGFRSPRWAEASSIAARWVPYSGIVWCPVTENGTWLARRDGKIYFTGNSFSTAVPPIFTILNSIKFPNGTVIDAEHDYTPKASRNDPAGNRFDKVDVFISGTVSEKVSEELRMSRATEVTFNDTGGDMDRDNWQRENGVDIPATNNFFMQLFRVPLISIPNTISVGGTTYTKDVDYWMVRDVTNIRNSHRARDGIEWNAANCPVDTTLVSIGDYSFNALVERINEQVNAVRLLGTDTMVHRVRYVYVKFNLAIMLNQDIESPFLDGEISAMLGYWLGQKSFRSDIHVADVIDVVSGVFGVDNVRLMNSTEDRDEVQTIVITGTPTGGTFILTLSGETTGTIAYNATAGTVETALEALPGLVPADVSVTGGPGPGTAWVVTFTGTDWGSRDVPLMTVTSSLTGGTTPAITITETTKGIGYGIQTYAENGKRILSTSTTDIYLESDQLPILLGIQTLVRARNTF